MPSTTDFERRRSDRVVHRQGPSRGVDRVQEQQQRAVQRLHQVFGAGKIISLSVSLIVSISV